MTITMKTQKQRDIIQQFSQFQALTAPLKRELHDATRASDTAKIEALRSEIRVISSNFGAVRRK